jgi:hypothetical protein
MIGRKWVQTKRPHWGQMGLHVHGRLAGGRRSPGGQGAHRRHVAPPPRRDAEAAGADLSLYQIHSATLSSGVLDDAEVRRELDALRRDGVAVGASVSGTEQAETIDRVIALGGFDTVQATWNLLERSAGDALQSAHEAGMGVIVKEALANGRLTGRGAVESLARAAARLGVSEDALAIAAVLARPRADTVLAEQAPSLSWRATSQRSGSRGTLRSTRSSRRWSRNPRTTGTPVRRSPGPEVMTRAAADRKSHPRLGNVRYRPGYPLRASRSA